MMAAAADDYSYRLAKYLKTNRVIACGEAYSSFLAKRLKAEAAELENESDAVACSEGSGPVWFSEPSEKYLKRLNPTDTKDQDHYKCLGLQKLRYRATALEIRRAYRIMCIRHHPDKRADKSDNCQYFTCITKAYEVLSNPIRRRAYDSIDPGFDDTVPAVSQKNKDGFFDVFSPVFEWNCRWSLNKHIPNLGNMESTAEEVNAFYHAWFNFKSWREFSYLDEEDPSQGECREERRWIQRQNMKMRKERKLKESRRIRQIVENAQACDPRILLFETREREEKQRRKAEREEEKRRVLEMEQLKQAEIEKQREAELEKERILREEQRKVRELEKNRAKSQKKKLRNFLKSNNYLSNGGDEIEAVNRAGKLLEYLNKGDFERLNSKFSELSTLDEQKIFYLDEINKMEEDLAKQKQQQMAAQASVKSTEKSSSSTSVVWSKEELQLVIKAMTIFPNGTRERWNAIAAFMTTHLPSCKKTGKQVLAKVKDLQNSDRGLKHELENAQTAESLSASGKASKGDVGTDISIRYDEREQEAAVVATPEDWTSAEQKLLEQALKTYSTKCDDRWERIASCIPGKTKRDCMLRYKHLADIIKAKKAAMAAAAAAANKS